MENDDEERQRLRRLEVVRADSNQYANQTPEGTIARRSQVDQVPSRVSSSSSRSQRECFRPRLLSAISVRTKVSVLFYLTLRVAAIIMLSHLNE